MHHSALLNVMIAAARKAARSLKRDFGEVENLQVSMKGPGDFVSAADRRADKVLITELTKARPGYGFLTEETGTIEGSDKSHRWIIDPLDGTTNFLHGIPIFCVSLGLERDGQLVAGVVYNPVMNELYVAERGTGAFFNDRRIRVAARRDLSATVISTGRPHSGRPGREDYLSELKPIMDSSAGVRITGSAAIDLAWVASGRFDAYWHHGLSPWDVAAGVVIVREAGGLVSDIDGGDRFLDTGSIVVGNEMVHRALLGHLKTARASG
jgi:myo-inositol-1(or 4)-monophosphatase